MKLIGSYLKNHPILLMMNILGGFFFMALNLGLPTILAWMIDRAIIPADYSLLYRYGFIMFLLIVFGAAGRVLLAYSSAKLTTKMVKELRNDLFARTQLFSHQEYETIGVASLVNRLSNDAFILMQFTEMALRLGVNTPLMFIGSIVMILITSPSLAWVMILALPLLGLVIYIIASRSKPISENQQLSLDRINHLARENLTGLRVIRAFAREDYQTIRFTKESEAYAGFSRRLFKLMGLATPLFYHILLWTTVLVVWFSLEPLGAGRMQVGTLIAFVEYIFHALFAFLLFSQLFMMYPRTAVSALRIKEIVEIDLSIDPNPQGIASTQTQGYLEFENVTFAYPGEDITESPALHNINFKAKPGEIIAFIGSTGSGKSTLVQLIPRFFDVTLGRILVDGVDVREYNLKALREKIGFIPQKALLFTGTIGHNLRYGREDAVDEELDQAVDIAQAKEFINKNTEGYEAFLSEGGSNLSGGQKQRLSIARAIVKEPSIYVFDDSFSALDYKTDAELRRRLRVVTKKAAVIVVAQRISSIINADQIYVLDEGKINGCGTHKELMANNRLYQEIAESQMKNNSLSGEEG